MSNSIDPRARRTRHLLVQALIELGAEGDLDALDVGDLAAKAGVGRSTFYQHFASKEDFLVRSFVDMLAHNEAAAARHPDRTDLLPSRALFAHMYEVRKYAAATVRSEAYPRQMAAGEIKLREIVEANLVRLKPDWSAERRRETAVYVAGGFIGLIRWWKETGLKQTPDRMQAVFERLSRAALEPA